MFVHLSAHDTTALQRTQPKTKAALLLNQYSNRSNVTFLLAAPARCVPAQRGPVPRGRSHGRSDQPSSAPSQGHWGDSSLLSQPQASRPCFRSSVNPCKSAAAWTVGYRPIGVETGGKGFKLSLSCTDSYLCHADGRAVRRT